jgi:ankyrin repeat protein
VPAVVSKAKMTALVRAFQSNDVSAGLTDDAALLAHRDERGRNWLHVCSSAPATTPAARRNSVRTADVLLDLGLDIDAPAFVEGDWQATPCWYSVARGRNLTLTRHLLERGCDPNHSLFAAAFNDDLEAIELLVEYGADVDQIAEDETPFLGAVKVSHFAPAALLLDLGADVNAVDSRGMTALHYMLKKGSAIEDVEMVVEHGARGDISDARGVTATEMLGRKRDPAFRALVSRI